MSMWNFTHESETDSAGANTAAGYIAGNQPFAEADALPSKRNVIATDLGWVRRQSYVDVHGQLRVKDEVLVAAHPGGNDRGGYANSQYLGAPDIATMQLSTNTVSGISSFLNTSLMTLLVTFNEPLLATSNVSVVATGRAGTPVFTLTSNSTNSDTGKAVFYNEGANNTVVLSAIPGVAAGFYKIRAQSLTVDGGTLLSQNFDGTAANTTITAAVSNTIMAVNGDVLSNGEFVITA